MAEAEVEADNTEAAQTATLSAYQTTEAKVGQLSVALMDAAVEEEVADGATQTDDRVNLREQQGQISRQRSHHHNPVERRLWMA